MSRPSSGCYAETLPELPEVEAVRRSLDPFLTQARIADVDVRRPDLRVPFPRRFRARLVGQTVASADAARQVPAGAAVVARDAARAPRHVRFVSRRRADRRSSDPPNPIGTITWSSTWRRAPSSRSTIHGDSGSWTCSRRRSSARHPVLSRLGPEPLSAEFDAAALARACRGQKMALKVALLDQRVVAGLGNIYASEALHLRAAVAASARVDDRDGGRRAARVRRPSGRGDQARADDGDRSGRRRDLPIVAVPRLRSRGRARVREPRLRRHHQAAHAGGPVDVLLSRLPAVARPHQPEIRRPQHAGPSQWAAGGTGCR